MCLYLQENICAQATPIWISPGTSPTAVYPTSCVPSGKWKWTQTCGDGTNVFTNMNAYTFNIPLNTSCCNSIVNGDGEVNCSGQKIPVNGSQIYNILPLINPVTSTKYPNDSWPVSTSAGGSSSNGLTCASTHGCPGATITWAVSGGIQNLCGWTSECVYVGVPNPPTSNLITVNATYNCNGNQVLTPITINVALQNPVITGPQSIGCGSNPNYITSNQVTYYATSVAGLGYYVWNWPSNMSPVGSIFGSSIVLNINGNGFGNVSVQAFSPNSAVSSSMVNFPVNVCCTPVINENTILNSGNTGYLVESGSVILSTNDIQSTGTATMHAGVEVRLLPGFQSVSGSQIHLYPAACSSGYYRVAPSQDTTNAMLQGIDSTQTYFTSSVLSNTFIMTNVKTKQAMSTSDPIDATKDLFNIAPNPTTGKVNVNFTSGKPLPMEIIIVNALGSIVYQSNVLKDSAQVLVDLSDYPNGMYTLKTFYNDKMVCKILLKTE